MRICGFDTKGTQQAMSFGFTEVLGIVELEGLAGWARVQEDFPRSLWGSDADATVTFALTGLTNWTDMQKRMGPPLLPKGIESMQELLVLS
jgi:hypothetical protein